MRKDTLRYQSFAANWPWMGRRTELPHTVPGTTLVQGLYLSSSVGISSFLLVFGKAEKRGRDLLALKSGPREALHLARNHHGLRLPS